MQQQKIIKLVHIYHQNYDENKSGTHFYGPQCICIQI